MSMVIQHWFSDSLITFSVTVKCDMYEYLCKGQNQMTFLKKQVATPSLPRCRVCSSHCSGNKFPQTWLVISTKVKHLWVAAKRSLLFPQLEVLCILILYFSCLVPHLSSVAAHRVSGIPGHVDELLMPYSDLT